MFEKMALPGVLIDYLAPQYTVFITGESIRNMNNSTNIGRVCLDQKKFFYMKKPETKIS